jgi:hypothetical protein
VRNPCRHGEDFLGVVEDECRGKEPEDQAKVRGASAQRAGLRRLDRKLNVPTSVIAV